MLENKHPILKSSVHSVFNGGGVVACKNPKNKVYACVSVSGRW